MTNVSNLSGEPSSRVVVVGTGPCGLGAAWRLQELGHKDWTVLEAADIPAGLARTITDDKGFLWDIGGHVIFSHYRYFTDLLDILLTEDEWIEHIREAWVWMRDTFIPYPLQNNIWRLPKEDLTKCLLGLVEVERLGGNKKKPTNFRQWLENVFGSGLMEVFLDPYNRKVWAYPPEELNVSWMGERVATVDFEKVIRNVVNQTDSLGWGPNAKFRFPRYGGTGSIWKALYAAVPEENIELNSKVVRVDVTDPRHKCVYTEDGRSFEFDHLVSTMPLDILICSIDGLKDFSKKQLRAASEQFRYSSSHIIGIGMNGHTPEHLKTKCWMYFPEDDCPFYRATVFSNYSPNNVPKVGEQWSLMLEVSESKSKPVPPTVEEIVEKTVQGCISTKLITNRDDIVSKFHIRIHRGYPTPFQGRDELCQPLFNALEKVGIYSRGRFGAWKYEVSNQDHSLMMGVECADHILFGTPEMTFRHPSVVNANKNNPTTRLLTKKVALSNPDSSVQ